MKETRRIRILIADDHPVVRDGLRALVELQADMEVAGEAPDGEAAVSMYGELRPDVTIMDLRLPKLDGIGATAAIRRLDPQARVLVLTSSEGDAEVRAALKAGATGYLLKGSPGREIADAIRRVFGGSRALGAQAAAELRRTAQEPQLTAREVEVLFLAAEGLHNQQIAERLRVSFHTVKVHLNHIFQKLDVEDRTEAVVVAASRGIIHLR